jgi:lipopolysaccharide transport system ATP-binding protein
MSEIAVSASRLAKRYRIGVQRDPYGRLTESLWGVITAPFRGGARRAATSEFWALRDVSFDIPAGTPVGVIGRNGAGKSTLLKILSRITDPTSGRAELHGRVGSLLEVGTGFHPELTGAENVYLSGAVLGMRREEIRRKFDDIVAFAETERFLDTPVKYYSTGMYVRLAFAVAAHMQPQVLLVDEVLAVGDLEFQRKCLGRMERVAGEGKTVVVVSHNMATVKGVCSRALLLVGGMLKAAGPVDDVVAEYLGAAASRDTERVVTEADHNPRGGRKIRARRIRLGNGVDGFRVHWRQPIEVTVEVEVFERLERVTFGASIKLLDGTFVFVVHSDDDARPPWSLEPGRYTVDVTLQNDLRPGVYVLGVGAHQEFATLKNLFDADAARIEVLEFSESGAVASSANPGIVTGVASRFALGTWGA